VDPVGGVECESAGDGDDGHEVGSQRQKSEFVFYRNAANFTSAWDSRPLL
jgi:hypothetical protein